MSKTVEAQVIERAIALLNTGHCWGALAKDKWGDDIGDPYEETAAKFCAAGALMRAVFDITGQLYGGEVLDKLARRVAGVAFLDWDDLNEWNDRRPKRVVIRQFEEWLRDL